MRWGEVLLSARPLVKLFTIGAFLLLIFAEKYKMNK
jgi:hypothetical protein